MLDTTVLGNIKCLQNFDRSLQYHINRHVLRLGAGSRTDGQQNYKMRLVISHSARGHAGNVLVHSLCDRDHFVPFLTPGLSGVS